jgi:hypothetical protein
MALSWYRKQGKPCNRAGLRGRSLGLGKARPRRLPGIPNFHFPRLQILIRAPIEASPLVYHFTFTSLSRSHQTSHFAVRLYLLDRIIINLRSH